MDRLKLFPALLLALFLGANSAWGQSLEQELSRLLAMHPTIEAARNDLAASAKGVDVAFSEFLPSVNLTGDGGYEHTNRPNAGTAENPLSIDREKGTVTLTETLFEGFRRTSNYDASKLNRDISEISLDATVQDLLLQGITTYHEVLRQTRLVQLAQANEAKIKLQLDLEDERVSRGAGISVDVLFAKARLQTAKERRVAFQGALRDANTRYIQLFNRAPVVAQMVDPVPPADLLPSGLEEAINIGLNENPDLRAGNRRVELADKQRTIARSDYYPRVDLVGAANWENNVDGIKDIRRDQSVVLQFTWEIFSGFETRARVARASAEYSGSMSRLSDTRRDVAEETGLALSELTTARERVELLQNAIAINGEVFRARKRLRAAGKETTVNVLDAETELNNAQINHTIADYDARVAVYRVLAALGRLTPQTLRLPALDQ